MKRHRLLAFGVALLAATTGAGRASAQAVVDPVAGPYPVGTMPDYFPVNFSILWPLATNAAAPDLWTHLDLALLLGRVGFVDGLQVGPVTWTTHDLRGLQVGVASAVGRDATGAQIGAGFSYADGALEGLQATGLIGWATGPIHGAQMALLASHLRKDADGAQLAGVVNVARRVVTGVQIAGAVNIGRVDGLQIAPFNVSQEVRGLQIGLVNIARRVDGLQIGVINVTDNLDGESLGLAPIPRRGGIHLHAWFSNSVLGNAGIKFASRWAYSILSIGLHSVDLDDIAGGPQEVAVGGGVTLGAKFATGIEGVSVASDLGAYRFFRGGFDLVGHDELYKSRILAGYQIAPRLVPFVGGGLFLRVRDAPPPDPDGLSLETGPELTVGLEL